MTVDQMENIYNSILTKYRPNIKTEKTHSCCSFGHIVSKMYGSKYYSYQWAEVYSHDMFSVIKKKGLMNSNAGAELVEKVLSKGGSIDPLDLLRDFLGREPNEKAFLEYIIGE